MKVLKVIKVLGVLTMLAAIIGCGSNGGEGSVFNMGEPYDVDVSSYLPIDGGIVTEFSGTSVSPLDGSTIKDLEVKLFHVEAGKVWVRVSGQKTDEKGEFVGVTEWLLIEEKDNQVLLNEYQIHLKYSDGDTMKSEREYTPSIVLLHDKTKMENGDYYSTMNVGVKYECDPKGCKENITHNENGVIETSIAASLSNVEVGVSINSSQSIEIDNYKTDVYYIGFNYGAGNVWFPTEGIVQGGFGLARGIGIVSVAGQNAADSNAIKYILKAESESAAE